MLVDLHGTRCNQAGAATCQAMLVWNGAKFVLRSATLGFGEKPPPVPVVDEWEASKQRRLIPLLLAPTNRTAPNEWQLVIPNEIGVPKEWKRVEEQP